MSGGVGPERDAQPPSMTDLRNLRDAEAEIARLLAELRQAHDEHCGCRDPGSSDTCYPDLYGSLAGSAARTESDLRSKLEAVLMDATVTYGIIGDDGTATPMLVERQAIVRALGYADESAWLARTAEINAAALDPAELRETLDAFKRGDHIHRGESGS